MPFLRLAVAAVLGALASTLLPESRTAPIRPVTSQQQAASPAPERRFPFVGEPAERVRVSIGDASYVLDLGGAVLVTDDGVHLSASMHPTRRFDLEGAFSFEFPREWAVGGIVAARGSVDARWTFGAGDSFGTLQRHGGDARAFLDAHIANALVDGASARGDVRLELDDRSITGATFTTRSATVGVAPYFVWVHEAYAFEAGDASFLLVLMNGRRIPSDPSADLLRRIDSIDFTGRSDRDRPIDPELVRRFGPLAPMLDSFEWSTPR